MGSEEGVLGLKGGKHIIGHCKIGGVDSLVALGLLLSGVLEVDSGKECMAVAGFTKSLDVMWR